MMKSKRTPEQIEAFASVIQTGGTLTKAMLAAGYSPATATNGQARLAEELKGIYLAGPLGKFAELGKAFKPEDRAAMVRGAMLDNLITGKDKAVASAKLLAQDKEVAMLVADTQIGVVVYQPSDRSSALMGECVEPPTPK